MTPDIATTHKMGYKFCHWMRRLRHLQESKEVCTNKDYNMHIKDKIIWNSAIRKTENINY